MRKFILIIFIVICTAGCAAEKTFNFIYNPKINFKLIENFAFDYKTTGIAGIDPKERDEMIFFIRDEIKAKLQKTGLIKVGVNPDAFVQVGLILKGNGKNIDPDKPLKDSGINSSENTYIPTMDYKSGSLIIDVKDPFDNKIIWRASIDTNITAEMPLETKKKVIVDYIDILLKDFPKMSN